MPQAAEEYRTRSSLTMKAANRLELEAVDALEEQEAKAARARPTRYA